MVELKDKIAVFGLGYIGLPFTAALANVGYSVIGVDIDKNKVEMMKRGEISIHEPGLKETLEKHKGRIEYTSDSAYAMANADSLLLTVGTPLNENEEPDYTQIESCINDIGKNLKRGQLIILKST